MGASQHRVFEKIDLILAVGAGARIRLHLLGRGPSYGPHCSISKLLVDLQTCATEGVDERDLCASLRPKDCSVIRPDEPEAKPAGQPEVGFDSGDVSKSDHHRTQKPVEPSRPDPDAVWAQFENRQWPAEIRATGEEATARAVPHSTDESRALLGHEPSLGAILRGTFPHIGARLDVVLSYAFAR